MKSVISRRAGTRSSRREVDKSRAERGGTSQFYYKERGCGKLSGGGGALLRVVSAGECMAVAGFSVSRRGKGGRGGREGGRARRMGAFSLLSRGDAVG